MGLYEIKDFTAPIESLQQFKTDIKLDVYRITPETLLNVLDNGEMRLDYKNKVKGGHTENIMS